MRQIGRVAIEQLRRQADPKAQRRGADLRDQLLERIGFVAEPAAKLARQPVRGARPVQLLVSLGRQEVVDGVEGLGSGQADQVPRRHVAGLTAPELDLRRNGVQDGVARRDAGRGIGLGDLDVAGGAVGQLLGVEDRVGLQVTQHLGVGALIDARSLGRVADDPRLVEDRRGSLLPLGHGRIDRQGLAEGEPVGRVIAAHGAGERQEPGVAPAERLAVGPQRQGRIATGLPGLAPRRHARLDAGDDIGDQVIQDVGHGSLGASPQANPGALARSVPSSHPPRRSRSHAQTPPTSRAGGAPDFRPRNPPGPGAPGDRPSAASNAWADAPPGHALRSRARPQLGVRRS